MGRFLVGAAAGSEDPSRCRGRRRPGAEHAPGSQFADVGETDSGQGVE